MEEMIGEAEGEKENITEEDSATIKDQVARAMVGEKGHPTSLLTSQSWRRTIETKIFINSKGLRDPMC